MFNHINKVVLKHYEQNTNDAEKIFDYLLSTYKEDLSYRKDIHFAISENPNVSINLIKKHLDFRWNWYHLSDIFSEIKNIEFFREFKNKPIEWRFFIQNFKDENLLFEFKRYIKIQTYKELLSSRDYISEKFVKENNDIEWNYLLLAFNNPNLSFSFWQETVKNLDIIQAQEIWINYGKTAKLEIIENNIENIPWDWNGSISLNKNVTEEFFLKHINQNWNMNFVSVNLNISLETISKNKHLDWDFYAVSQRSDINLEFLREFKDKDLFWGSISRQDFVDINVVLKFRDKSWDWPELLLKPNISLTDIKNNLDLNWQHSIKMFLPFRSDFYFELIGEINSFYQDAVDDYSDWNLTGISEKATIKLINENKNFPWLTDVICAFLPDIDFLLDTDYNDNLCIEITTNPNIKFKHLKRVIEKSTFLSYGRLDYGFFSNLYLKDTNALQNSFKNDVKNRRQCIKNIQLSTDILTILINYIYI